MEEEMAAASAQMKAREEENLAKQTPSVRSVNEVIYPANKREHVLSVYPTPGKTKQKERNYVKHLFFLWKL